jgi:PAS domain S-box-containing protein
MPQPLKVLIVEDSAIDAELLVSNLRYAGFDPAWQQVDTEAAYLEHLHDGLDLILSDYQMPLFSGLRALELLKRSGLEVPFIIVSGTIGEETAVAAMKQGAADYLLKDRLARLESAVRQALESSRLHAERHSAVVQLRLQGAALATAANAIIITDPKGTILWLNPAFTTLTGYTAAEAVGQTPRFLKSGQHDIAFYHELWGTILSGRVWRGEFINRRKDGSLYHGEQTITPVRDEAGAIMRFIGVMNDVTARKRAEEEARETHKRLQQLLDYSPAVLYALKLEGEKIIPYMVSENMTRLLGFTVTESLNYEWWLGQLHPDDRKLAIASISKTIANDTSRIEYRLRHKDGSYRWVDDNRRLVRDATGAPAELVGVWADITARKRAEEVVSQVTQQETRRRKLKSLIDFVILASAAAIVFGLEHRYNIFIPSLRWILQRSDTFVDEIVGTLVFLCFGAWFYAYRMLQQAKRKVDMHEQVETALKLLHDEMEQRVQQRTAELRKANEVLRSEISDRKRAEESLRESEERFRQLAETITKVFWILDPMAGKLLYVSPAYERIWGRSCESLLANPRSWLEAIRAEDQALVKADVFDNPVTKPFDHTYRITQPGGAVRWIHDRGFPIRNTAGQIYRVVGVAEDITEHRNLEEQFRQAQKMEAIGTLAGGIAHDFNNILSAIVGYTQLAQMILKENPAVREHLGAVLQAASRATDLVRQILAFSRQQQIQERRPIQLHPVVAETLKLLRSTIPSTIEFDTSLATDVPMVLADATQIHQILMNLGTNAWHAMKDRTGRLQVKLEKCVVDEAHAATQSQLKPGIYVHVSVSDTGCGMDQPTLRRIFEPFFTTKPLGEGTGLGLAVVHGIMKDHDGAVTVYSQPGEGTIFHLYFPVHAGEAAAAAIEQGPAPHGHGERILFVDDEELLVRFGQKTLAALGYEVEITTQPMLAFAMVRTDPQRFALVLTDQTMPGMTGIFFANQLRQIRPELPIILMTGYSASLTPELLEAAGIRQLLLKPMTLYSLGTAVHTALSSKPAH